MAGEGWDDQSNPGEFDPPPPRRDGGGHPAGRVCLLAAAAIGADLLVLADGLATIAT